MGNTKELNLSAVEKAELKYALKKGGAMLKISQQKFVLATILVADNNGEWETMRTVSKDLTLKLQNFYSEPVPAGFHMLGLKWFIEKYC